MRFYKEITLKNGKILILRSGEERDAEALLYEFNKTHAETDNLLTYPDENNFTVEDEAGFLKGKYESENEIEILAEIDNMVVGSAGIESLGNKYKICHRADFGISVLKDYWGMGIGRALTECCIECAKQAGYEQVELSVVAENSNAIALYESFGFVEFGRNPKGFKSRKSGYQEVVLMRLEF